MRSKSSELMDSIIEFIDKNYEKTNKIPSIREIADGLGVSKSCIGSYLSEMTEKGLDPVDDYYKYTAEKRRQEKEQLRVQNEQKEQENQRLNGEITDFIKSFGEETLKNVLNDAEFDEFSKDLVGKLPLKNIYERFLKYNAKTEEKAEALAIKKDARRKSSSGALGKKSKPSSSILDLSPEEFQRAINEIARQY